MSRLGVYGSADSGCSFGAGASGFGCSFGGGATSDGFATAGFGLSTDCAGSGFCCANTVVAMSAMKTTALFMSEESTAPPRTTLLQSPFPKRGGTHGRSVDDVYRYSLPEPFP